jgi:hypothetical protein
LPSLRLVKSLSEKEKIETGMLVYWFDESRYSAAGAGGPAVFTADLVA